MSNDSEGNLDERLTRIELELERQKTGLGLLGVKPCSRCAIFQRPITVPYSAAASWFALIVSSNGGWTAVQSSAPTIG